MASPFVPPSASPRFHPKYIPEMTYPTPSPHSVRGPRVRERVGLVEVCSCLVAILKDNYFPLSKSTHPPASCRWPRPHVIALFKLTFRFTINCSEVIVTRNSWLSGYRRF